MYLSVLIKRLNCRGISSTLLESGVHISEEMNIFGYVQEFTSLFERFTENFVRHLCFKCWLHSNTGVGAETSLIRSAYCAAL